MEPSVRFLRFPNRRFSCKEMSAVPAMIGNTLLVTFPSVNASSFFSLKSRNASRVNRDGDSNARGYVSPVMWLLHVPNATISIRKDAMVNEILCKGRVVSRGVPRP